MNDNLSQSDLNDPNILRKNELLLNILLKDQTTGNNIKWGTDSYNNNGYLFHEDQEITADFTTGWYEDFIRPRSDKNIDVQQERQRNKAEVFTPSWVIKIQVDAALEEMKDLTLVDFLQTKWLEITCGEAPYMVNRYDMNTGEIIQLNKRYGFIDSKFKKLNEKIKDEQEWIELALEVYKASYGYEYQGDSLLLARENLILTFIDNYFHMFGGFPDNQLILEVSEIVSLNVFQMDGLTYEVPYSDGGSKEIKTQLNLFEEIEIEYKEELQLAKVRMWDKNKLIDFKEISERNDSSMKFDVVIGNPPYQIDVSTKETKNGQKAVKNIFHHFQQSADKIANCNTVMIYPGGRWMHQSGKGMAAFGSDQMNDKHLKKIIFYPKASDIFEGVNIGDGVSIVIKDMAVDNDSFDYEYVIGDTVKRVKLEHPADKIIPFNPDDISIVSKIDKFVIKNSLDYLHDNIYPRTLFGIESSFVELNPDKVIPYDGQKYDEDKYVKIFANDRAGKSGRSRWYLTRLDNIPSNRDLVFEWQIVVSSANAGGQKRNNQISIIDNMSAFARSRLALRSFSSKSEAENFYNYANSKLIKYAFLMSDENLSSLAKWVPDMLDYSDDNTILTFSDSEGIYLQLIDLIGLSDVEVEHINNTMDNLRS